LYASPRGVRYGARTQGNRYRRHATLNEPEPLDYEDIYVPNEEDAERHREEALTAMQEALARAPAFQKAEVTDYLGNPVPEAPPLYPGEDMKDFWLPHAGTLAELLLTRGTPKEEERWACDNVWKPGSLTLIVGAQQSFKSWAMFDLMYHAAKGTDWLDHGLTGYDAIVYLSNEKSYTAIYERLWLLFEHDIKLADRIYVKHREDRIQFGNEQWDRFVEWVHTEVPGRVLIILDTLTSLAPAGYDENNLKDVSKVLSCIRTLQQGSRMDILLVHHFNAMGERPRGHTSLDGEVDGFVKFDRRGKDLSEVTVKFEPKDGLPSLGTYVFDPDKGMFKRATARSLHVGNIVGIIGWYQERNGGEGITVKELKERHFNGFRYEQLERVVMQACDDLQLKRENKRSMLTNREANIITVMTPEERERILATRRRVEDIETDIEVRVSSELRAREMLDKRARGALMSVPEPTLFPDLS